MSLNPFSTVLANRTKHNQTVAFTLPEDWLQGRTAFGGVAASLALAAMRDVTAIDRPVRSLQTNFVGPLGPGPFTVSVQLLRQGKSMSQVQATISQNEQPACVLLAIFGESRPTTLPSFFPEQTPIEPPDAFQDRPYIPGLMPVFTQHIGSRIVAGGVPFSGSSLRHNRIYLKLKDIPVDLELLTVLLSDAIPPAALALADHPIWASTISWWLEFRSVSEARPDDWWLLESEVTALSEGFGHHSYTLWTPSREPIAFGRQMVALFEGRAT